MRHAKHRLTVAVALALLAGGAMAASPATGGQTTPAQPPATTKDAQPAPAPASSGAPTTLATVVVTSQSRKQQLEDVPIAVQVVTAKNIEMHAATDLSKMDDFIPGLVVYGSQPTQPSFQLRGIGGSGFGIGTESAVGVYVDGVYSARSGAALLAFNDVKRIEVLKGPQGTLFGRNAAAGAISIITNRPGHEFEADARLRFGNYGERYGSALLNVPFGKRMAFRISAYDNQSDGWVTDLANGRKYGNNDDRGVRASWEIDTENTQYWLTLDHERLNQMPEPHFGLVAMSNDPQQRPAFPPDPSTYLDPLHAPLYNDSVGAGENRRYNDAVLHIDHYMGWGTLSSITAWTEFNTFNRGDWDGTDHIVTYLDETNVEANRNLYQELKLSGSNDRADWVSGISWYKEDARQRNQVNLYTDSIDTLLLNLGVPTGTPDGTLYHYFNSVLQMYGLPFSVLGDPWREEIVNEGRYTSMAAYGDVIWHLNDHIDLTTGARFSRDSKDFTWYNAPRSAPALDQTIGTLDMLGVLAAAGVPASTFRQNIVFTDAVGIPVAARHSWTDFSPRVVLSDHFTQHVMGYVSVAKGYKSGGYNMLQVNSIYAPEKVWNYEVGVKSVFPDQHLVLNASLYHYNYSNLQQLTLDPNTAGSGVPRYITTSSNENATGLDFELQWNPIDALLVNLSGAYINSRYGKKTGLSGEDLSGAPTGVPLFSAALGLQYTWQVGGGQLALNVEEGYRGAARCNADSQFQGSCQISPNFQIGQSTTRTDVRLGWTAPSHHWGVALFANNLFNQRYVTGVDNTTTTVFGTPFASITPPRFYGIELNVKY